MRQSDRERERQGDRETGRQGDRETERQRDRETERHTPAYRRREAETHSRIAIERQRDTHPHTVRETEISKRQTRGLVGGLGVDGILVAQQEEAGGVGGVCSLEVFICVVTVVK